MAKDKGVLAWAPVGIKSGKVLRDFWGRYGIYTRKIAAQDDCPRYGEVRRVRIFVQPKESK